MSERNKLKGYALISTIFIGLICLLMLILLSGAILMQRKNADYIKKQIENKASADDIKEYLLTYLNNTLRIYVADSDSEALHNYLTNNESSIKFIYNNNFIKYSRSNDCFIIYSYFDEDYHKEDFYHYSISGNKIVYEFYNTLILEGRVDKCS